ncbi:hypothetical protein AAC387_Pa10g0215 [Persea americana]
MVLPQNSRAFYLPCPMTSMLSLLMIWTPVGMKGIRWTIRVEVFQVSITTVGDRPVVHRGTLHSYHLGSWHDLNPLIYSVFVCDHSNKSDIEADASSGSYSCEELKKRAENAVEYVKGDSKKQKTTLPE